MSKKKKIVIGVVSAAAALLIAAGVILVVMFAPKGPFTGTVTDFETGEPLKGVSVTDGRNVVKTDDNGTFTLKGYNKSRFVTVTTPAGYTTDDYYIPVGSKKDSYDFRLEKYEASLAENHSFLQISDTEIGENGVGEWIDHVKGVAQSEKAAFLIHTGDICYEAGLKRHKSDMNTENMGLPVRYVIGNHDYVKGKYGEQLFESIYGPVWYSFEVGNTHYVVTPIQHGDVRSAYSADDRWRWLENDLANTDPDMNVVIFNHTKSPSDDYILSFDGKKLDLKDHNLIAWVYGHYHYNYVDETYGVLNISTARPDCGGIDSSASGTRKISISADGKVSTKMFYYDMPASVKAPENAAWSTQLKGQVLYTDVVAVEGKVYTATVDDDFPRECGVYCLDEKTGEIVWYTETVNSVKNNIVYSDGNIIAQDTEGNVYCLNGKTGEKVWTSKVKFEFSLGTSSGICADDKAVYAGSSSDVTALNLADGTELWSYHRGHGENSPAEFIVTGDKLIISPHWDALAALNKNTGKVLWENSENNVRFRSSTPLIYDDNMILVADYNSVFTLNADTGEMTSYTPFEGYDFASSGQPVIDGKTAYIPLPRKGIMAFDMETKTIIWETATEKSMVYTAPYTSGDHATVESTPVLKDGVLYFGASDGYFYKLNAKDGTVISKTFVGAPVFGKAVLIEDGAIFGDFAGRVTKIKF